MPAPDASVTARLAVFAPLENLGRAEAITRRLADAISLGLLADGEQLPSEPDLAAQLGVATVTVREALSELRNQGLIVTRRGRGGGSFVRAPEQDETAGRLRRRLRDLTVADLRDLGDHYSSLAAGAALLAAERASPDDLERLGEAAAAFADAVSGERRHHADGRFHVEVAAAAQSARLTREEIRLQTEIGPLLWLPGADARTRRRLDRQHREIVAAIAAEDAGRAADLARRHVTEAIERLVELHLSLVESGGGEAEGVAP
ncbi:GntR family transcriptional regulator [Actinomadura sp. NBRC 104412]|uniref:FadR/GntR family transcriptional regulator n=1 Tax=Actinomadura sp. NBRC 104412 TaxID=3032203 RepID=UPI0024A2ABFB|nr:FCD domain-containing protein [Actinomadura sp. NBRC 104412]GLZ07182.1 GntR family transcriptional regulator [Actinomadura sp. NBRC 104412]